MIPTKFFFLVLVTGLLEEPPPLQILADKQTEPQLTTIGAEYQRRTGQAIKVDFFPTAEVEKLVQKRPLSYDVVLGMPPAKEGQTKVSAFPGARKIVWKYPGGEPVWVAVLSKHPGAEEFNRFVGGPTAHQLWAGEAGTKVGFVCIDHHAANRAEQYQWVVQQRLGHTYRMTALRMLREIGGIRDGICIDIGCGPGDLDIELAKRSNFKIIGLDIDAGHKPFFEKKVRAAELQDRLSFVEGDAQKLPFPDHYADVIVSRGTLIFVPDIGKCLKEVQRVLKPTGVAFLGGQYLYAPGPDKITTTQLRAIVKATGLNNAQVIEELGQWVKITGPQAPREAHQSPGGPYMLAGRISVKYSLLAGKCLLLHVGDGGLERDLQQGFLELTDMDISALYPSEKIRDQAKARIRQGNNADRIHCLKGTVQSLPFPNNSLDVVAGVGPILLWGDKGQREKGMQEIYRVLKPGGAALVGGQFKYMPDFKKVSSDTLRQSAVRTGIPSIRVIDDGGQWIEIVKGIDREPAAQRNEPVRNSRNSSSGYRQKE